MPYAVLEKRREYSREWQRRQREAARGGAPAVIGRPPRGKTVVVTCRICKTKRAYYVTVTKSRPKTCSQKCGWIFGSRRRSERPKDLTADRLYEMYWGQNLTAREIADRVGEFNFTTVLRWLRVDGTARRAGHWRTYDGCIIEGCGLPTKYLRQQDGTPYGRYCRDHQRQRETRRHQIYNARIMEEGVQLLMKQAARLLAGLPESVKTDAQQEIVLAALSGELPVPLTRESVKPYITKTFRENADAWKFLSLQAPTSTDEGAQTWGDRLGLS